MLQLAWPARLLGRVTMAPSPCWRCGLTWENHPPVGDDYPPIRRCLPPHPPLPAEPAWLAAKPIHSEDCT